LEETLAGLVLMDSAPDASWQNGFMGYVMAHPLPKVIKLQETYESNPNNDLLRDMVVASVPYFCAQGCPLEKFDFLKDLPYNFRATQWSAEHFDGTYKAQWIPQKSPTLIFAGDQDRITPLSLFQDSPLFQRDNIIIEEIPRAGHYPWVENPADVHGAFERYFRRFL
jgi:pimeloyl-ACP methyl ester carboxylesterase